LPILIPHIRRACLALACLLPVLAGSSAASASGDPHPVLTLRSTAPMITLTGHPRARTKGRTTTIPFWAHGHPRSVSCRLDGGQVKPCTSPARLRRLSYGRHHLRVHAVNARGSVTVTISWTVLHIPAWKVVSTPVEVSPPELYPPAGD
jgi:hypothetical protein